MSITNQERPAKSAEILLGVPIFRRFISWVILQQHPIRKSPTGSPCLYNEMCALFTTMLRRRRWLGRELFTAEEDPATAESARIPQGSAGGIGIFGNGCLAPGSWTLGGRADVYLCLSKNTMRPPARLSFLMRPGQWQFGKGGRPP